MAYIRRYRLNELVETLTNLVGATWKNTLILSAIAFLPATLAYFIAFQGFFSFIGTLAQLKSQGGDFSAGDVWKILSPVIPAYGMIFVGSILYGLGYCLINLFASKATFKKMAGETEPFGSALNFSLGKLPRAIGQGVLVGLMIVGGTILWVAGFVGGLLLVGLEAGHIGLLGGLAIFFVVLWTLAYIGFAVWVSVATTFAQQAIVWEDAGVVASIKRSFHLVKKQFWRTFGYLFLFSLVLSFAIGILTGPIIFATILPGYIDFLKSLMDETFDPANILSYFSGNFLFGFTLSFYVQAIALSLVYPIFLSIFYIDLRVRKGELADESLPIAPTQEPTDAKEPPVE